jgi:hypothetical protein
MSVDSDFRALLAGHAALTALVSTRIAQHAVPQDSAYPLVVFVSTAARTLGIDNTLHGTEHTWSVQCFAETAVGAQAVADAVLGAVATNTNYVVLDMASGFDEELGLDAVTITVNRWVT